jgi:hypothetical protein
MIHCTVKVKASQQCITVESWVSGKINTRTMLTRTKVTTEVTGNSRLLDIFRWIQKKRNKIFNFLLKGEKKLNVL